MPFNGLGTFTRIYSWVTDAANGLQVNATRMDADTNDIANGLSQCVTKDGQSGALTAALQMGSNKITGLANGTASGDAVNFGQVFTAPTFTGVTLNGATVTGTASFTGALNASAATSVLVPTPSLDGQAVNLSTMNAALASGSPAPAWVSGTTYSIGQIVYSPINFTTYRRKIAGAGTTDPSLDGTNWALAGGGFGNGGTTLTGNVTLTSASPAAMSVTPATPGLYVTLPDATTVSRSTAPFSVYNNGDFDYGVKDSAGTQLGWIRARTGAVIGLADNSTAAGVWAYYGLEKTGITASIVNSTLAGNNNGSLVRITLDANRTCFLFGGTSCYAQVYDASTQTWGSATLVRASISAFLGILSATNQVLVISCDSTTGLQGVALTISGVGVTVNAAASQVLASNFTSFTQLIAVGSSFVFSYTRAAPQTNVMAVTVTGTTVALGTETLLSIITSPYVALFASGSVLRTICGVTLNTTIRAQPYTVAGTVLTSGTLVDIPVTSTSTSGVRTFLNGNNRIVCHYLNASHFASIISLNVTTETASSVTLGTAPTTFQSGTDYIAINSNKTLFLSHNAGNSWRANILTDTSGTATAGTEITGLVAASMSETAALLVSGNNARCGFVNTSALSQYTFDCSGTSPVLSSVQSLSYSASTTSVAAPDNSDSFGVKSARNLVAGTRIHIAGNASLTRDTSFMANGLTQPNVSFLRGTPSVAGAASNEAYSYAPLDGNTTGYFIQRIEAAA